MKTAKLEGIDAELREIARKSRGLLRPAAVVKFAADPETALHSQFEWDDTAAAHAHRLWQARSIINIRFKLIGPEGKQQPVRAWHSVMSDRTSDEGGYRGLKDVMDEPAFRAQLLAEAKQQLQRLRKHYHFLTELAAVWDSVRDTC